MGSKYQVELRIGRQEDGLWRVEVPGLSGCWVDGSSLDEAISAIQEGIAMALDEWEERGWELPSSVMRLEQDPERALLPILIGEHRFAGPRIRRARAKQRTG